MSAEDKVKLIIETGNIKKYLTHEKLNFLQLNNPIHITSLIKQTKDIEYYLDPKIENNCKILGLDSSDVLELVEGAKEQVSFLKQENREYFDISVLQMEDFILRSGNIKKFLNKEARDDLGLKKNSVKNIIKESGIVEEFIAPDVYEDFRIR